MPRLMIRSIRRIRSSIKTRSLTSRKQKKAAERTPSGRLEYMCMCANSAHASTVIQRKIPVPDRLVALGDLAGQRGQGLAGRGDSCASGWPTQSDSTPRMPIAAELTLVIVPF